MFETPYQTTPCRRYKLAEMASSIRLMELHEGTIKGLYKEVEFVRPTAGHIGTFTQPLTQIDIPHMKSPVLLDGRGLLRSDNSPVRQDTFMHMAIYAHMTYKWSSGNGFKYDLYNIGDLLGKSFIGWVVPALSRRLTLNDGQIYILRCLTAVYFTQLFGRVSPGGEDVPWIRSARLVPGGTPDRVRELTHGLFPYDLPTFVEAIKQAIDSPKVGTLTPAFIESLIQFSFGQYHMEESKVALEYPPALAAMAYSALNDHGYKKSAYGMSVDNVMRSNRTLAEDFHRSMKNILE